MSGSVAQTQVSLKGRPAPAILSLDDSFNEYAVAARALDQLLDAEPERYDPTDISDDAILGWELPHHGETPTNKFCGNVGFRGHFHTQTQLHYQVFEQDCATFRCPTCKSQMVDGKIEPKGYEKRGGMDIADRLDACSEHFDLGDMPAHPRWSHRKKSTDRAGHKARPRHIIVSPPQGHAKQLMQSKTGIKKLWGQLYRVAQSRGIVGGVAIFHPLRIPSRWNKRQGCSSGPHWHVLGFTHWGDAFDGNVCATLMQGGPIRRRAVKQRLRELGMAKPDTDEIAGDGWLVKVKPGGKRNLYRTAAYVLSHAGRPIVNDPAGHVRRHMRAAGVNRRTADDDPGLWQMWKAIERKAIDTGYLPPFIRDLPPATGDNWRSPDQGHAPDGYIEDRPDATFQLAWERAVGDAAGGAYPAFPRGTIVPSGRVERTTKGLGRVVRWFGQCSYNKIPKTKPPACGILCDICERELPAEDWHRIEWRGESGVDPPPSIAGFSGHSEINAWHVYENTWSASPMEGIHA